VNCTTEKQERKIYLEIVFRAFITFMACPIFIPKSCADLRKKKKEI
jgi:hypothetical protein